MVGVCPECGTPARATILAAVDPYANLLMPIPARRLTALGIVAWSIGALGAALVTWAMRARDAFEALIGSSVDGHWLVPAAAGLIALSGLGALVLIRPHAGIPRWQITAACVGCGVYAPLLWVYWRIHAVIDGVAPRPYFAEFADPARARLRLLGAGLCLVILLCLRPNARLLAARSLLLREGRVDRQTMLAMAAVLVFGALGDGLHLLARHLPGDWPLYATTAGTVIIAVAFMMLTLGLAGIAIDVWRIWPVIVEPAPSFRDLLGDARSRRATTDPASPHPPNPPYPAGAGDAASA